MGDLAFTRWVFRQPRARATVGLTVLAGLFEGISLTLLIPLLSLVGVPIGETDVFSRFVAGAFALVGVPVTLVSVLVAFVLLQSLSVGVGWLNQRTAAHVQHGAIARWRADLAEVVEAAPWSVHARLRPARIAQGLTTDPERVGGAVLMLLRNLATLVLLVVYVGLALRTDWATTLAVTAAGVFLLVLLRGWSRLSARHGQELVTAMRDMHDATHHWITGMKLIKLHGGHADAVTSATRRVSQSHRAAVGARASSQAIFKILAAVLLAVTVGVAATRLPPASLLFLVFLFARTLPRLGELQRNHQQYRHALPAHGNLEALVAELQSDPEPPAAADAFRLREGLVIAGAVVDHGRERVGPIDLELPAGATRRLTGPSGSGKTTTLDLAAGILEPVEGEVRVDGVVLDGARRVAWRAHVGYLPQEPFLLDGSVRENLLWAAPGASESELVEALRLAHCDFALEQGLDMEVGDQGRRLSGGQRRRVALAMALARKPLLLVLDEPYAGLDAEASAKVREALEGLEGMTVLIAEHGEDQPG